MWTLRCQRLGLHTPLRCRRPTHLTNVQRLFPLLPSTTTTTSAQSFIESAPSHAIGIRHADGTNCHKPNHCLLRSMPHSSPLTCHQSRPQSHAASLTIHPFPTFTCHPQLLPLLAGEHANMKPGIFDTSSSTPPPTSKNQKTAFPPQTNK
jgi:hypothetical protein